MEEIIYSKDTELLKKFILTVGVVSNHGNWFTAENHNKELKVLAQSYDWLIFLTDQGLAQFIDELILNPTQQYIKVQQGWFSIIAPEPKNITELKNELIELSLKTWKEIL